MTKFEQQGTVSSGSEHKNTARMTGWQRVAAAAYGEV